SASWPTPLAILAWLNESQFDQTRNKAINFLLSTSGIQSSTPSFVEHNGTLKGWSWNEQTHSWVIPTAITIIALRSCGYDEHERVQEGIKLLLDRQLPSGGWNYGNTIVFEQELKPIPECTGHALNALAGYTENSNVTKSIEYLKSQVPSLKSPLSLSWAILGLGAWGQAPENYKHLLLQCLAYQSRYGKYSTDLLSQVLISYYATSGLLSIFENMDLK
ncbi:MAG: prenyltransferase/squalene oxidase repeat-containing protein, partial [Planctomycetota bacterium]